MLTTAPCASLATDTDTVRSGLATYGNDLLSLGVDGLRLDAAKSATNFALNWMVIQKC